MIFCFSLHEVTPAKVSLIFHLFLSPCTEIPEQDKSIYRATHKEKAVEIAPFSRAKTQENFHLHYFCAPEDLEVFMVMDFAWGLSGYANAAGQELLFQLPNTVNTNFAPWYTSSRSLHFSYFISSKLWKPHAALNEMLDTQHSSVLAPSKDADNSLLLGCGYLHYSKALKQCEGPGIYS